METNNPNIGTGHPKMSPKFFFLSLGSLVALIATVTSFLNLAFSSLDKKFPDVLNAVYTYGYNSYDYTAIRTSLATIIIVFPIFLLITYFWNKTITKGIGHIDDIIKKWMLYLVIFLSSIVIIVDLVTLVRFFVAGEITNRFIYKVLIALLVAIFVGIYYMFQLTDRKKFLGMPVGITSAIKSTAWVILLIAFSFSIIGSPAKQRLLRMDERRVTDLQSIQGQIINYWQQKEKIPATLADLKDPFSYYSIPVDPEFENGKNYEYKNLGDVKFELCATFTLPMQSGWVEGSGYSGGPMMLGSSDATVSSRPEMYPVSGANDSWNHKEGRVCFERTIDKEIYQPYPKQL